MIYADLFTLLSVFKGAQSQYDLNKFRKTQNANPVFGFLTGNSS